ncbi:hypothetical protein [Paenibacillus glacialis]|nr:hypothetical protein [Paenibacillus glacialis]
MPSNKFMKEKFGVERDESYAIFLEQIVPGVSRNTFTSPKKGAFPWFLYLEESPYTSQI